ncbi:hypothetical protein CKO25_10525 [Thiocapsa imhoffii]|uniref:Glycosyltransferase 2-like domain-containing protein n=1 Tax=Thiocapsa imhoffii TaxID=382777 RepID=A0A9X1B8M9_9GAMM|nr:glycosyltransferase family A protein [Thiocapsa imhoffii]MBK1645079.1 hypothetical protein [Thiocapsa imhoffii]
MSRVISDLVSTIIPVYNRASMLLEAVDSVLAQTWRPIEIIIVDDGSTDDTPATVMGLVAQHPDIVKTVRITNSGPGPAREAGLCLARGEFIQYLDSDDRLLPEKFERQVKALRDHPGCGIAYGRTRLIDGGGKVLRTPFKWTGREFDYLFPALLVDRWWCTHTPLYRRTLTDMIGAWSDLRWSQDWEYDARAGALRTKLVSCHADVSEHRMHDEPRQTGHGRWLAPLDRVRFFDQLSVCAQAAGIGSASIEMRHYVRWLFHNVRECGQLGDAEAARDLFDLALRASERPGIDLRAYGLFARIVGWERAARGSERLRALVRRKSGMDSISLSWMETS